MANKEEKLAIKVWEWNSLTREQKNKAKAIFGIRPTGGIVVVDDNVVEDGVEQAMLDDTFTVEALTRFLGMKGAFDELFEAFKEKLVDYTPEPVQAVPQPVEPDTMLSGAEAQAALEADEEEKPKTKVRKTLKKK
ncbi:MAG: hypothetical protein ACLGJB_17795 [Blastocatellia bacterium]